MLLRSGETHLEAEGLADKIGEVVAEKWHGPFPYGDCRWLSAEFLGTLEELVGDLDMWFFDIVGTSGHGKRLLKMSEEKVFHLRGVLSLSFYEKHPEFAWLERHIVESNTPELYERMVLAEELRRMLLTLFDLMIREKFIETRVSAAAEQTLGADSPVSGLYS